MALGGEVVDFVGLHFLDDANERAGVGHVAVVEIHETLLLHVAHPLIEIKVLDATGVERTAASNDAMHFISFFEEKLGEERTVLTGDAGD